MTVCFQTPMHRIGLSSESDYPKGSQLTANDRDLTPTSQHRILAEGNRKEIGQKQSNFRHDTSKASIAAYEGWSITARPLSAKGHADITVRNLEVSDRARTLTFFSKEILNSRTSIDIARGKMKGG